MRLPAGFPPFTPKEPSCESRFCEAFPCDYWPWPESCWPAPLWLRSRTRLVSSPASDLDQKYYLRHSPLRKLDLTPLQAARVNSALERGEDPTRWLSPAQQERASGM